jgi:hypothetical protein
MISEHEEQVLRDIHSSLCITWGTDAPYAIGSVSAERIGYAGIPCVVVTVHCREVDISALVPIVRQRVYSELAERGWGPETIQFRPTTQRGRRQKFTDQNESSSSYGRNKMGNAYRFSFEMLDPELKRQTFSGSGLSSFRKLPERTA